MRAVLLLALLCLDREGLARQIRRQLGPVRDCYARALAKEPPGFGGKLVVRFGIEADGGVGDVGITSSELHSTSFETCVTDAVKRWRFPKPPGGGRITVTYPFVFKPG